MSRRLILISVLAGTLAFAGVASATPTTPQLAPLPATMLPGTATISWSPSVFQWATHFYTLRVQDYPFGSATPTSDLTIQTTALSRSFAVAALHRYEIAIYAVQAKPPPDVQVEVSAPDRASFAVWPGTGDWPCRCG